MKNYDVCTAFEIARECYDLAHTPPGSGIWHRFKLYAKEADRCSDSRSIEMSRAKMRDMSLDYQRMLDSVISKLPEARAQRLLKHIVGGSRMSQLSYQQRQTLCLDVEKLAQIIMAYRQERFA